MIACVRYYLRRGPREIVQGTITDGGDFKLLSEKVDLLQVQVSKIEGCFDLLSNRTNEIESSAIKLSWKLSEYEHSDFLRETSRSVPGTPRVMARRRHYSETQIPDTIVETDETFYESNSRENKCYTKFKQVT